MSRPSGAPRSTDRPQPLGVRDEDDALVSAQATFRLLLILLAVWTFFAGFSMLTQGVGALSFGRDDAGAERVIGAQMLMLVPLYALLAWRRREYRLLLWVPYVAQVAVILPVLWELLFGDGDADGLLLFIVAAIFLALLVYVRWSSHPLGFFQPSDEPPQDFEDEDEDWGEDDPTADADASDPDRDGRPRRYRRTI